MKHTLTTVLAFLFAATAAHAQGTATATLSVTVTAPTPPPPQITITFTPANPGVAPNPIIDCNIPSLISTPPGTVISTVSAVVAPGTGDGNPLQIGPLGGDTVDYALAGANAAGIVMAPNANIVVTPHGLNCPTPLPAPGTTLTDMVTVPVTQP